MTAYYLIFAVVACALMQLAASLTIGRRNDENTRVTTGVLIILTIAALLAIPEITDIGTVLVVFVLFSVSAVVRMLRERYDTVNRAREELYRIKRDLEHYAQTPE